MNKQQLKHESSIAQILRVYGRQFRQIKKRYSDEINGRCAVGVIMSYFGWNGMHNSNAPNSLQLALHKLKDAGIRSDTVIKLNDSGKTFDEIADCMDLCIKLARLPTNS
jgi:hypothetical protein